MACLWLTVDECLWWISGPENRPDEHAWAPCSFLLRCSPLVSRKCQSAGAFAEGWTPTPASQIYLQPFVFHRLILKPSQLDSPSLHLRTFWLKVNKVGCFLTHRGRRGTNCQHRRQNVNKHGRMEISHECSDITV